MRTVSNGARLCCWNRSQSKYGTMKRALTVSGQWHASIYLKFTRSSESNRKDKGEKEKKTSDGQLKKTYHRGFEFGIGATGDALF